MKVALGTVEVTDEHRRGIAERLGHARLATRDEVRRFILSNGTLALDDFMAGDEEGDADDE